jgi:hypothetical protein
LKDFNRFLIEGRIDFLKQQYKDLPTHHDTNAEHRESDKIIDHFAAADPTPKKVHTQWVLKQYKAGKIQQEDAPRINETLKGFEEKKKLLPHNDINRYSLEDLETHLHNLSGVKAAPSNNEVKRQTKLEGADLIHDENGVTVHKLKTEAAAKLIGAGTKWCTNGTTGNMFNHYNKDGPIYVIHAKNADGTQRKVQFHPASKQLKNELDHNTDEQDLVRHNPELRNVEDFQGTRTAFTKDLNKHGAHLLQHDWDNFAGDPRAPKKAFEDNAENALHNQVGGTGNSYTRQHHLERAWSKPAFSHEFAMKHVDHTTAAPLLAKNPNLEDRTYDALMANPAAHGELIAHKKLPEAHKKTIVDAAVEKAGHYQDPSYPESYEMHPNIAGHIASHGNEEQYRAALPWMTPAHKEKAYSAGKHLDKAVKDSDATYRFIASRHPGPHLDTLLHDPEDAIRAAVLDHKDPKHIAHLANDKSWLVSAKAKKMQAG